MKRTNNREYLRFSDVNGAEITIPIGKILLVKSKRTGEFLVFETGKEEDTAHWKISELAYQLISQVLDLVVIEE